MKFYTKEEAILRMNLFGSEGRPFIFIVNYKQDTIVVEDLYSIDPREMLFNLNGFSNVQMDERDMLVHKGKLVHWQTTPITLSDYSVSFRKVMAHIHAGNSYLVNLTCSTPVWTNLSLPELYHRSVAKYKMWLKDRFVVFSPEIFVRIKEGFIYSYPMKGTIDATLPDAARQILNDKKEEAEHATIVDLIRNDLSVVADHVTVSCYRFIDKLQTNRGALLQVSSEIIGKLPECWTSSLGNILFKLLPAGSITGAPKKRTLEIIAEAETYERGFYTGVMGYFDGQNLDSAVMIRFLEQGGDCLLFKSGGGITAQSDLQNEYNEMKQKVYVPIY